MRSHLISYKSKRGARIYILMLDKDAMKRFNATSSVEPDAHEKRAIEQMLKEEDAVTVSQEDLDLQIACSGKIALRLPKSLHKSLIEGAKREGVSLNQYVVYKLAHSMGMDHDRR